MFTGIVQAVATIEKVTDIDGIRTFTTSFPAGFCQDLQIGASVAIDGTCLTVTEILDSNTASFDVMLQSLHITTLGAYQAGAQVNAERAAKDGAEIGGHPLSGHIDFTGSILDIKQYDNNFCYRIDIPAQWMKYIFSKGYIAINGASLTLFEVNKTEHWFEVWLIPETRRMTTFAQKQVGDALNIEIERSTQVLVDTIRDALDEKLGTLAPLLENIMQQQGINLASDMVQKLPKA
ncbi:riboflavin synthase subunit alpha [Alkanindiges sp. WGS2144]|uniref:riboflavin synthase subunit alpha n=1 Tax=Alkanindiges sp. WGS2144 TaxID=3366808 RepID=UPI003750B962